ncbi:1,4-alpha-glucan branching protein GlgB [Clostridium sp.]|uniref:1,4-alpha-glucan branching protein GlgB n=1 Tax=Clostridium sp. TaxID=1506 RepID=UPI002FC90DD9
MRKSIEENYVSDYDVYLFHEGNHYESYKFMGAHFKKENNRNGYRFTLWAPNAKEVRIVGDFNNWIGDKHPITKVKETGFWSGFIPGLKENEVYKYEIITSNGDRKLKADPYGFFSEKRPNTASITLKPCNYVWKDQCWTEKRKEINSDYCPVNIFEVHLGSWRRRENGEFLSYRELAKLLPNYAKTMGYTHIEIMPLMEHPLDDSWGYQVTGYYSPTSRYGSPKDLKYFIDCCHRSGVGVILDWVPGHFCKDDHGLFRFDGSAQYEYEDPQKGENSGWGAANFDLGKPEVKSFLISNALYWLGEFHIDGLRMDAVANMLYLDYCRESHGWTPNKNGGNENLEAMVFIKELNEAINKEFPDTITIAEESTTWPKVTGKVEKEGLGFSYKWNMGWMNDMLKYMGIDPICRKHNHVLITFSLMYAYSERFILPISHDEVVHGKKSLIDKMWGDYWNKFAGFRAFLAYMYCHPGKKTLFMGNEFAQFIEWRFNEELEWHLLELDMHKKAHKFTKTLNKLYKMEPALWKLDSEPLGFQWIDVNNSNQSIIVFMRKSYDVKDTLIIICNFTPVVYYDYKIGVPFRGTYVEILNTDHKDFGGSGQVMEQVLFAQDGKWHNESYTLTVKVPPMATMILKIENIDSTMFLKDYKDEI